MASGLLSHLLESAHRHLETLRQGDDGYKQGTIDGLMSIAYSLGKMLSGSSELRSESAFQRLVDETVSVLKARQVDLDYYSWTIARRLRGNWENNEWEQLCVARSGLQFFIDLFRETALAEEVAAINSSDLDEFIRERGNDEGYLPDDEIPPGIPPSQWWWWYPEPPRLRQNPPPQR